MRGIAEIPRHRAGHGFDVGHEVERQVELDIVRRALREAHAGDQGEGEEERKNFLHDASLAFRVFSIRDFDRFLPCLLRFSAEQTSYEA